MVGQGIADYCDTHAEQLGSAAIVKSMERQGSAQYTFADGRLRGEVGSSRFEVEGGEGEEYVCRSGQVRIQPADEEPETGGPIISGIFQHREPRKLTITHGGLRGEDEDARTQVPSTS